MHIVSARIVDAFLPVRIPSIRQMLFALCLAVSFPSKSQTLIIVLWIFDLISIFGSKTTDSIHHISYTQTFADALRHLALRSYVILCPTLIPPTTVVCRAHAHRSCNRRTFVTQQYPPCTTPSTASKVKPTELGARRRKVEQTLQTNRKIFNSKIEPKLFL